MANPQRKLSQFVNVAANSVATVSLDELKGHSVRAIILELGGTSFTKTHIDSVTLTVGGKAIVPGMTGSQINDLNKYMGFSNDGSYLSIWFGDPTLEGVAAGHVGDLDLSFYRKVSTVLEVAIGGATAPTLQAYALIGPPKSEMRFGFDDMDIMSHRSLVRSILSPAAAVTKQAYPVSVGSQAGAHIQRLAFFHANLTNVELKKNSISIHDDSSIALNTYIQEEYGRVPQTGLYVLDHVVDGALGKADATVNQAGEPFPMQINLTTSAADTITTFADVLAPLQLI